MSANYIKAVDIYNKLNGDVLLCAILEHYKEITLPLEIFDDLINKVQIWPNDYVAQHGSFYSVSYDEENNSMKFQLGYYEDTKYLKNSIGSGCIRNRSEVGFVNHDSPRYRK